MGGGCGREEEGGRGDVALVSFGTLKSGSSSSLLKTILLPPVFSINRYILLTPTLMKSGSSSWMSVASFCCRTLLNCSVARSSPPFICDCSRDSQRIMLPRGTS